jgi:hypothetical protein
MHGGLEQIHLMTYGMGTTLLQAQRQDKFQCTEEVEQALQDLKHHLQSPPILTVSLLGKNLLLYIVATTHMISMTIVVEHYKEGHAFGV